MSTPTIFTVGHSTRGIDDFLRLLQDNDIQQLVDVRRFPSSRRLPHFNSTALAASLQQANIAYHSMPSLGGRRKRSGPREDPQNAMWENAGFRYFADYALTPAGRDALQELETLAAARRCAIMCAEAVWWRCHRRIITDHLLARGHAVQHIMGPGQVKPASLTPGAVVDDAQVRYPAPRLSQTPDLFDGLKNPDDRP